MFSEALIDLLVHLFSPLPANLNDQGPASSIGMIG